MLRNYLVFGDLTGSRAKTHELTWTVKTFPELFHHPLFSLHGASYFLSELTRTFWRGEYAWHGQALQSMWADRFYLLSSALLIAICLVDFALNRKALSDTHRWVSWQALVLIATSVLFLAAISLAFDFHDCGYPSRPLPYFVSGRIISGVLLPFVSLYAIGLEWMANRLRRWVPPVVLVACLMLLITASEIRVRRTVFSSPYNFFALYKSRP
jgi:hypothetical protein